MTTHVKTQIFVIIQSNKGWSEPFAVFFNEEKAIAKLKELLKIPKGARNNFKLERWNTEDCIIYTEETTKPF